MKRYILFFVIIINHYLFSQQVLLKTFETDLNEIEVSTFGLDDIKIITSDSNKIEISLFDENANSHTIHIQHQATNVKIDFELLFQEETKIFKKFITKRLHRASVIIKLPKNKSVTLHGDNIDILSESYQGDLHIYIHKGLVKFQKVQGNVILKLFQGNIFATLSNVNTDIISNKGKININDSIYQKKYQKKIKKSIKYFQLNSIHANVNIKM